MDSNNNSDYYCKLCDKSIKIESKKKHLNSQYHQALPKSIMARYFFSNPKIPNIEDILRKHFDDYNKKVLLF